MPEPVNSTRRQLLQWSVLSAALPLSARTALFLASDEARFVNAADIVIDGGRMQLYHE